MEGGRGVKGAFIKGGGWRISKRGTLMQVSRSLGGGCAKKQRYRQLVKQRQRAPCEARLSEKQQVNDGDASGPPSTVGAVTVVTMTVVTMTVVTMTVVTVTMTVVTIRS